MRVHPKHQQAERVRERPAWLRVRAPSGEGFEKTLKLVEGNRLHTVCQSAQCPNMGECWASGTATFMILGNVCTRTCGFCAVKTGRPTELDTDEPRRVAEAVKLMGLSFAVVTSVNRDELEDGGAAIFAATIRAIREASPGCQIEVLIPDFRGDRASLDKVIEAAPEVLNHNVETVPRLYKVVRPQAKYERSLEVLAMAAGAGALTKSGLMLGLGEELDEVKEVLRDLKKSDVRIVTMGQYLPPTPGHLKVHRFVTPAEFDELGDFARGLGFAQVESGPLVRSSYHAKKSAHQAAR